MSDSFDFLGRGWSFPPSFDRRLGVSMVEGTTDIEQCLQLIFETGLDERLMQRFGCDLSDYVFETLDGNRISYLQNLIRTAILYHEPRIDAEEPRIDESGVAEGRLLIEIEYTVRKTNSRFNFVYPFYLRNEGG